MLLENQLVRSESEFSKDWLGRSDCYMRALRFHNGEPSIATIAVCASKLQHYERRLAAAGRYEELSMRFIELSEACHSHINDRSEATWLIAPEKGSVSGKFQRAD